MGKWYPTLSHHIQNYSPLPMLVENVTQVLTFTNNIDGTGLRILLSNEYGNDNIEIETIRINTWDGTWTVMVDGQQSIVLKPAQQCYTDCLEIPLVGNEVIQIVIYIRKSCVIQGYAGMNSRENCQVSFYQGFQTSAQKRINPQQLSGVVREKFNKYVYFGIRCVEVFSESSVKVITVFGDSLVHQACWSNALEKRLKRYRKNIVVVNEGISGNRVLMDNHSSSRYNSIFGQAGIKRFQRDVYKQVCPDWVIIAEGINDLVHPGGICENDELPSFADLIEGLKYLIKTATVNGSKVALCTLSPFYNYDGIWNWKKERIRNIVNNWIRNQNYSDCIIDIEAFVRDEQDYKKLKKSFDSGDHIHFNLEGGNYIAEQIPAELFL